MYKKNLATIFLLFIANTFAQTEQEVMAEAWLLYNSEKASWHGTDIVKEFYPDKLENYGGYFSYTKDERHICVFYSKAPAEVTISISFDDTFIPQIAEIDSVSREMTAYENDLYELRTKAVIEARRNSIFKYYKNTNANFIPLISGDEKRVYVITGPLTNNIVVFGNDYLITFNKRNKIKSVKALHQNFIPIEYSHDDNFQASSHTHSKETGHIITATDICTLMLYCHYTNWNSHIVLSDKNVSIWNCESNELLVITRKAWEKIYSHKEDTEKITEDNKK